MKKSSFSLIVDKWTGKLKASSVFSLGEWGCLYFRFIHWGCFWGRAALGVRWCLKES
ncbi:hypothetical protein MNL09_07300 [Bartonella krasnovii]|uniref:hypothetical protein n=1 Tax=Bartonella krasnovii TaxID=2267275 RepID=UPI001F4CF20B|nr:hypothetical protein [Bartonella krasnovii]UNF40238.1 hypothetical protein MNL09_07300 [Bartonella krasnovii]UNF45144.1 hypothetical protein MNL06_06235 [Bartonella krasnovii]UNF48377.1 hypothetical protein MNL04_06670 [Bartonella krasnovii]